MHLFNQPSNEPMLAAMKDFKKYITLDFKKLHISRKEKAA